MGGGGRGPGGGGLGRGRGRGPGGGGGGGGGGEGPLQPASTAAASCVQRRPTCLHQRVVRMSLAACRQFRTSKNKVLDSRWMHGPGATTSIYMPGFAFAPGWCTVKKRLNAQTCVTKTGSTQLPFPGQLQPEAAKSCSKAPELSVHCTAIRDPGTPAQCLRLDRDQTMNSNSGWARARASFHCRVSIRCTNVPKLAKPALPRLNVMST